MEETTLLVEIDDLHRLREKSASFLLVLKVWMKTCLENSGELTGGNVGVDVQDLTLGVLSQTGQDGQASCLNGSLDGSLVDTGNLADETILGLVEVVGGENTGRDGSSTGTETLKGSGELEVLLEENSL